MLKISQVTNFPSLSNWIKAHSKPYNDHVCVGCDGCGRTVGIGKWNHTFIRSRRVRINTRNVDNKSVYSVYEGSVRSLENGNSFAIFFDRRKKNVLFFFTGCRLIIIDHFCRAKYSWGAVLLYGQSRYYIIILLYMHNYSL